MAYANPISVVDGQKACRGCGVTKPLEDFYKNKGGLGGRQSRCRPCFVQQVYATPGYAERSAARHAVNNAILAGRLVRPATCSGCGAIAMVHGHHDDYARQLDVRWLCKPCHDVAHLGDKNKPRKAGAA